MKALKFLHQIFEGVPGMIRVASYHDDKDRTCDQCRYKTLNHIETIDFLHADNRHLFFYPVTRSARKGIKASALATRVLWLDVDSETPPEFPSTFTPTFTVTSGHGYHFYWLLDQVINVPYGSEAALMLEDALKGIAKHFGGDISPTHISANMRLPGSFNIKNGDMLPVRVEKTGPIHPARIVSAIARKERASRPAPEPKKASANTGYRHESADAELMLENCAFMRYARDYAASISEPVWFDILRVCAVLPGGHSLAHQISEGHPEYDSKKCSNKLKHASRYGLAKCKDFVGEGACGGCQWAREIKSPAGIPYKLLGQPKAA